MKISKYTYPPRYGPEWGSGGVFGLKYHDHILYFTVAFEAESHFITSDMEQVYRFELIGKPGPRSGGDTYNAVEAVDREIYFGGWVHAPAIYGGRVDKGGRILFYNKYSHVHVYDTQNYTVRLLWSDTIGHESKWAGEISEILYDTVNDRLIVARADGHQNLGIYSIDRKTGESRQISENPGLKGTHYLDYMCFDVMKNWIKGIEGIQVFDPITNKHTVMEISDYSKISVDGGSANWPLPGTATTAYSRLFFFVRGGLLVGDPLGDLEPLNFVRLFDFGLSGYSPTRTMAKPLSGGVLVAFNAYTHGAIHARNEFEKKLVNVLETVNGPSILLYITPPVTRIIGAFGGRITGFEKVGDKLLLATSTEANLGADDATPIDTGFREIVELNLDSVLYSKPLVVEYSVQGWQVMDSTWGGIPLYGYKEPKLVINSTTENKIKINEYVLSLPPYKTDTVEYSIGRGKQVVDLSGFKGIVSFKLEKPDTDAKIRVILE